MDPVDLHASGDAAPASMTTAKAALLERLRRGARPIGTTNVIPRCEDPGPIPASFAQERLWFLHRLDPSSPAYNMVNTYRMRGALDEAALRRALDTLMLRHEPLRTTFQDHGGQTLQVIAPPTVFPVETIDLTALPASEREAERERLIAAASTTPIDLETGPIARAQLLRHDPQDHELVTTIHHIAFDELSELRFTEELAVCYEAFTSGQAPKLPELPVRYQDHARWQRQQIQAGHMDERITSWRDHIGGVPPLELPTDTPRPATPSGRGRMHRFTLGKEESDAFRALCRDEGATLFMGLLAAYEVLLHRHSGQEDFAVGTPVSGRARPELEGLIGFFVNTLPLRADLTGTPTFRAVLERVRAASLQAFAQADVPFERIVEAAAPDRDPARTPIFQVLFSLQNEAVGADRTIPGLDLEARFIETPTAKFDISLYALDHPDGFRFWLEYATDLFDDATITALAVHYQTLLAALPKDPGAPIGGLPLLSPEEHDRLHAVAGPTTPPAPLVLDRFDAQVDRAPGCEAVRADDGSLTYLALQERADAIADRLRASGVRPGAIIGLATTRGIGLLPALLGILRAGAAYLPLDPALPDERLGTLIEDAGATLVLADPASVPRLQAVTPVPIAATDGGNAPDGNTFTVTPAPVAVRATDPRYDPRPGRDDIAYVVYTSGSTGTPKGTPITHAALANVLAAVADRLAVGPDDTLLGITTVSFDIGTLELLLPLTTGGRLRLLGPGAARDPAQILAHLDEATLLQATPTTWRMLVDAGWAEDRPTKDRLRAIAGGEPVPPRLAHDLLLRTRGLWNGYGPSETAIYSTLHKVDGVDGPRIPIGLPIDNTHVTVVDSHGAPVPVGVAGELVIGGIGVSPGYIGRRDLTQERFVDDPTQPGERVYRTGDLVRWRHDGTLDHLGRIDRQVKVRGVRIEPAEIEHALEAHPAVSCAVVTTREDSPGDVRLVAHVVATAAVPDLPAVLRAQLQTHLPEALVPTAIMPLDALPLLPSGKVDVRALPRPRAEHAATATYRPPETATEQTLAGIWSGLIGVERIGRDDGFFALGGHSLLAMHLVREIHARFGVQVPLRTLFQASRLIDVAARIDAEDPGRDGAPRDGAPTPRTQDTDDGPRPLPDRNGIPLSPGQERMWFLHQLAPDSPVYNMAFTLRLDGPIDTEALEAAFTAVAARHEALRTTIRIEGDRPVQVVHPAGPVRIQHEGPEDPATQIGTNGDRPGHDLGAVLHAHAARPFDLRTGPVFRVHLVREHAECHHLLLVVHHIAFDEASYGLLVRDLETAYARATGGHTPLLPPAPLQYGDHAAWQRERLEQGALDPDLDHWSALLAGTTPLDLPTDHPRPARATFQGGHTSFTLPREVTERVRRLADTAGATPFMTLLAAFGAFLHRVTRAPRFAVGIPVQGRSHPDLDDVVGFFVNTLPLPADATNDPSFHAFLEQIRERCLDAFQHGDAPYGQILERTQRTTPDTPPLVNTFFSYEPARPPTHGRFDGPPRLVPTPTAKFDLSLYVTETSTGLQCTLEHASDILTPETANGLAQAFQSVLLAICADPDVALSSLPLATPAQQEAQIQTWTAPIAATPQTPVHHLIVEQADRTPDAIAVEQGPDRLSYRGLVERSEALAARLRRAGAGPDTLVGIALDRSVHLVTGILAILQTGAAYVPLDPNHPRARLQDIIEDAAIGLVLTEGHCADVLPEGPLRLHLDDPGSDPVDGALIPRTDLPPGLAYVIYTSGSTGRPKGVAVGHPALTGHLFAMDHEIGVAPGDRWLSVTTLSFDIAALELFLPLIQGATVVIATREETTDPHALARAAADATILQATPATWRLLLEGGWRGAPRLRALSGGETLAPDLARRLRRRVHTLWNVYGPTEATIWATLHRVADEEGPIVPIGRPLANTRAYVLDDRRAPVPPGFTGELVLGGAGIAAGYLGRRDLDAERFIADPFLPGARAYRTGDLVRQRADGALLFLGRADRQLKVRGFRIEPAEIETVLREQAGILDAAVTTYRPGPDDVRLVAYVVPVQSASSGSTLDGLQEALAARLPAHMVPRLILPVAALPLTPNGKIDLAALPPPRSDDTPTSATGRAPEGPIEGPLAEIWRDLLAVGTVHAEDDFFALGGHSLLATRLAARIALRFDTRIPLVRLFEARTLESQARLIGAHDATGPAADPVIARTEGRPQTSEGLETDMAATVMDDALSFGEQRLLFLHELAPESAAYNMTIGRRLEGALDVDALHHALRELVRRHEPLRTTYVHDEDGRPRPRVDPRPDIDLPVIDVPGATTAERDTNAHGHAMEAAARPFDLQCGPLIRPLLLRLDPTEHLLVLTVHHIAFDEWSIHPFIDGLAEAYAAIRLGRPPRSPALPRTYRAHAVRERVRAATGALDVALDHWCQTLRGVPSLDLPTDRPRPATPRFHGDTVPFQVPAALVARLAEVCRREEAALHMGLLAVFQTLLHRYTGQEDFAVGTPVTGRADPETEDLIGFFVNTLALRADLSDTPDFLGLVRRVRRAALDAYAHAEVPFERIVEALGDDHRTDRMPVFQVAFLYGGTEPPTRPFGPGLEAEPYEVPHKSAKFDLTLALAEDVTGGLRGHLEYDTDLYDLTTIERMRDHFLILLEGILHAPEARVADAPMLSSVEAGLLDGWGQAPLAVDRPAVLHHLITEQAQKTPDAVAIEDPTGSLTYRRLDEATDRLARALIARGVQVGDLIGISLPRSMDAFVTIIAVLKAGAAFFPLDLAYPTERLAFMIEDTRPRLIVAAPQDVARVPTDPAHVVPLAGLRGTDDPSAPFGLGLDAGPPLPAVAASDLAYLIYTSGSTGRPKGVLLEHAGPCNLAAAQAHLFGLGPGDRVLQFASLNFDASVWELLMALTTGATLVIPPQDGPLVGETLADALQDITIATLPPTALGTVPDDLQLPALHTLVVAGEPCPPHLVATWSEDRRFVNAYGPTETSVCATAHITRDSPPVLLPIGTPLPNLEAHVFDKHLHPVPIGVPGELCVGGAGLARGYLGRPETTAERFVQHPTRPDTRLYRTGDRVRWRPDGTLEFLGRVDHQVKVRGHRIEPGEIEACLLEHDGVSEAVVVARKDENGVTRLFAYVVTAPDTALEDAIDGPALRAHVETRLPAHMVPAIVMILDALPLTPNRKVDRDRLPDPREVADAAAARSALPVHADAASAAGPDAAPASVRPGPTEPRDAVEAILLGIWEEVLQVQGIGIHDNFFGLGGDSILSIQVVARARRNGVHITARQLFDHQTIAALRAVAGSEDQVDAEQGVVAGTAPLTPIQHWFFARDLPARHHFNQSILLEIGDDVEDAWIEAALAHLVTHHDALRLRFTRTSEGWTQHHATPEETIPDTYRRIDLSDEPDEQAQDAARGRASDQVQAAFDLAQGPLLRGVVFDLGPGRRRRLLLVAHHLVVDGVSWRILLEDLERLVDARARQTKPRLPPKTTPFREWAERLVAHAQGSEGLREELGHWLQQTTDVRLPRDRPGPNTNASEETVTLRFDAETTERLLKETAAAYDVRPDGLLLAALSHALERWTGHTQVLVDVEGHGREDILDEVDLTRTIGWFTTIHPLRIELLAPGDPVRTLADVQHALRGVPHRGIGHGLLTHLGGAAIQATLADLPAPEVSFNYLGRFDHTERPGRERRTRFHLLDGAVGREHARDGTRNRLIEVNALVQNGRLGIRIGYSHEVHHAKTLQRLADDMAAALQVLMERAPREQATSHDLPEALIALPATTLDRIRLADPTPIIDAYPLTPMQHGMVYHSLSDPASTMYVEQSVFLLDGPIDHDALAAAWRHLVTRHDVFRTRIAWEGLDAPLQIVQETAGLPIEDHDWSGLSSNEQAARLVTYLHEDRARGFDLGVAPLMRIALIRLDDDHTRMVWTNHHAILDGWSLPIVLAELGQAYEACKAGQVPDLPPVTRFRSFVTRLRPIDETTRTFWQERLDGIDGATRPASLKAHDRSDHTDGIDPDAMQAGREPSIVPGEVRHVFTPDQSQAITALVRTAHITPNTLIQGAWAIALARMSGQDDVVFGATVAGRPADLPGVEESVGLFINTIPVRIRIDETCRARTWLGTLQRDTIQARDHEHTPLVEVQRASGIPAGTPLFDTLLVYENYPWGGEGPSLPVKEVQGLSRTNYPLTLVGAPGNELSLRLFHDPAHYDTGDATRVLDHVVLVLSAWLEDLERPLGALPPVAPAAASMLTAWGATRTTPTPRCIHTIIGDTAHRHSDAIAIETDGARIPYADLVRDAVHVATRLRSLGAKKGDIVAFALTPSHRIVPTLLGILEAGCAYLPLDPSYPEERLRFMLQDSGARLVVTDAATDAAIRGIVGASDPAVQTIDATALGAPTGTEDEHGGATGPVAVDTMDAAYLIYTSGSTGTPKGVVVTHHGAMALAAAQIDAFRLGPGDRVLQASSWSFDASFWETLLALGSGATLVIPPTRLAGPELQGLLAERQISAATLTPSVLKGLDPDRLPDLRVVVSAGEALDADLVARWAPGRAFYNAYGPTEATVCATVHRCDAEAGAPPPIGRPFAAARIVLVDARLRPVPPGVPGEIAIGGNGIALGYHHRAALTADRFVPDPEVPGGRLYRSGDLGRWRGDGTLEFLGRIDEQVKVRGHRIECGEVEAALRRHDGLQDACVVALPLDGAEDGPTLVAYVVASDDDVPPPATLRSHLAETLPSFMVPTHYVPLPVLPLNPSGKVDRRALPHPRETRHTPNQGRIIAPRDAEETIVATIWSHVLDVPRVSVRDDFFDLGGHSLSATQVVSRIRDALGIEVPLRTLFAHRTVETLAAAVRALKSDGTAKPLPPIRPLQSDTAPLSFAQQRLWFLDQWEPNSSVYNVPAFYRLKGPLDVRALERALDDVLERHQVLRTVYRVDEEGLPYQVVRPHGPVGLALLDLTAFPRETRETRAQAIAEEEARRPFDLLNGPVHRMRLVRVASDEHWLLMAFHHIAFDGWSMGVLLEEVRARYSAHRGSATEQPPLAVQYADHAAWQRQYLDAEVLGPQIAHWQETLTGVSPLALPTDRPRPPIQSFRGAHRWFAFGPEISDALRTFGRQEGVTLFMPLLAAYEALLHRWTGQDDFAIGTPIAGRTRAETEDLVGFFVNTLVLRADIEDGITFRDLVRNVRDAALAAYANQDVPFESLVNLLAPARDTSRSPLFQTMFVLQDDVTDESRWDDIHVSGIPVTSGASKFDLTFFLANAGDRLEGLIEYRTDLFDDETMARLSQRYETLLTAALADPDAPLSTLPVLSRAERERLIEVYERHGIAVLDDAGRAVPIGVPGILHVRPDHQQASIQGPTDSGPIDVGPIDVGPNGDGRNGSSADPTTLTRDGAATPTTGPDLEHPLLPGASIVATHHLARIRPDGTPEVLGPQAGPRPATEEATSAAATAPRGLVPPETPLEEALVAIWSHALDIDPVGATDNFFEIGGDSILAIRVLTLAKQDGIVVTAKELFAHQTVRALAAHLETRGDGPISTGPETPIPLRATGDRTPFFLVHPAGGGVACYRPLLEALPLDRPIHAFQARGIDEGEHTHETIDAMATAYLEGLRSVRPNGPYLLGGWSFGAVVAHEMAHRLEQDGDEVQLLALMDPTPIEALGPAAGTGPDHDARIGPAPIDPARIDPTRIDHALQDPTLRPAVLRHLGLPADHPLDDDTLTRHLDVFKANLQALRTHTPTRLDQTPTLLLLAEETVRSAPRIAAEWRAHGPTALREHVIQGDHTSLLMDPEHVRGLARLVQSAIEDSDDPVVADLVEEVP